MLRTRLFRSVNQLGRRVLVRTTEADRVSGTPDPLFFQNLSLAYVKYSINATQLNDPEDKQTKGSPHPVSPVKDSTQTLPQ